MQGLPTIGGNISILARKLYGKGTNTGTRYNGGTRYRTCSPCRRNFHIFAVSIANDPTNYAAGSGYAAPDIRFHAGHSQSAKPAMLLEYVKAYPDNTPNSREFSAELVRIFFTDAAPDICPIVYAPIRGRFVYENRLVQQCGDMLHIIHLLRSRFATEVSQAKCLVSRLNISNPTRDGEMHQRGQSILHR